MQDASLPKIRQLTTLLILTLAISLSLRAEGERRYLGQVGSTQVKVYDRDGIPRRERIPILYLGSQDNVHINFDLLGYDAPTLAYRIKLCNADGVPSSLPSLEYISGFDSDFLAPPSPSYGTRMPYQHYHLSLPNEHTDFKVSGNYLIEITHATDSDSILLSIPIAVSEETAKLSATASRHTTLGNIETHQQIDVVAEQLSGGSLASDEVSLVVVQNGIHRQVYSKPSSVLANQVRYQGVEAITFEGGNEFRRIEYTSEYDLGQGVETMRLQDGIIEIQATPSQPRQQHHQHEQNLRGRSIIATRGGRSTETEVDYVLTTFSLLMPYQPNGDIILAGDAMRYLPIAQRTMHYDNHLAGYICTMPLKMGYHEWLYLWSSTEALASSVYTIEGSYKETSNDYTLLLYKRAPSDRADRLIATLEIGRYPN